MNNDTTVRSTLSDAQRASLAARLRRGRTNELAGIPRRDPNLTEIPLSFGQEQLWIIDQLVPGSTTYNVVGALRMHGPLDIPALERSLTRIVARHESLRTRLVSNAGIPSQVIDNPHCVTLEPVTIPGADTEARLAALAEHEAAEAATPFDLATGPLFRVRLLRLSAEEHTLLVSAHHAVIDGWSFGVLVDEMTTCYEAEVAGAEPHLPALPVQLADFALWERDRLQGEVYDRLVDYWREALDGIETVPLPTDRPRPLMQSIEGGLERLDMGAGLAERLRALGQSEGTTLFTVVLTAVQVLLHRYSGADDIPIGTASANRGRPELATMIGYLVNSLVARGDMRDDPTFTELLACNRDLLVSHYAHQDLPFAKLVDALRVERDPSRAPLFQTGLTLAEAVEPVTAAGVRFELVGLDVLPAKFDLNVSAETVGGELRVTLSYATALFDSETAAQLLRGLRTLLTAIADDPVRRLSALPVMPADEWHREVEEWNDTAADFPVMCLHERFEQQVTATPDAIAAELGDERWTYARLNAEANRIARRLRALGVHDEVLVGVSMQPSLRRLAGILGILKAGGGYVPLDPDLPNDRLTYMINDAAMRIILTDDASEAGLPADAATVISLDRDRPAIDALNGANLCAAGDAGPDAAATGRATPSNVAYVIYTSGSTGRPKGVVVEHAQVLNFATGMIVRWPLGVGDRILQFASLNFDVSAMDMFLSLLSGATAVFGSRQTLLSPPRLTELMRSRKVSFACLPPAVVSLLRSEDLPDLRVLISAGEALSSELVRDWVRPGLTFCNGYGPTEAAIGATMMVIDGSVLPPPIGRPMANYKAYVLDAHLNPQPVGVVGELHLGGACVTRGYLHQPALTEARFIANPFVPGTRMYKTGDLVRRMRDGAIQFVGRIDGQVKIRGLRVELGEIESVLAGHTGVAQAVVVVRDDAVGEKQLVGYVRPEPAATVSVADLRQAAGRAMPAYMVPTHIIVLETFPLTPNGKIDTAALPRPDDTAGADTYRAPRTLLETVLVDMFAVLLGNDRVGVDDSFFDLGGNSLQAMRLITQLRDELAVDTDVTAIFLAPTPGQLAVRLRAEHGVEDTDLDQVDLNDLDLAVADGAA